MDQGESVIKSDVLIIGAGPVGIFAAFKAGMLGMKSIIVDSLDEAGGQCASLYPEKPIYDIPSHPKIIANDLVQKLQEQASIFSPQYYLGTQIMSYAKEGLNFLSKSSNDTVFSSKIIVIAAGAGAFGPNRPPLDSIQDYENKSVFYHVKKIEDLRGKKIAIAGGGDSAIDWALNLADISDRVYLIHRRDKFTASPASMIQIKQLEALGKVEILTPYQLKGVRGSDGQLDQVIISSLDGAEDRALEANILLPCFGLSANLGPLKNWGLNIKNNSIEVNQSTQMTNIEGIYAVGDICLYPGKLKLILTGFSECATALHHSYSKVFDGKSLHFTHSTSMKL